MERYVLEVSHFQKRYGGKVAVRDLSLLVEPGDIFGFVGHNGAGKTTLIRSVVGAQPPSAGTIRVCGTDVVADPVAAKRRLAYVPDSPDVYDFLTGIQYLDLIADVFGVAGAVRRARIEELAGRLELTGALGDAVGSYSHGMRQKLVLVGALLHDPELLVLDEPFVGLDPAASHELKALLRERAAAGAAVFFSSHVLEVVERLCNKVGVVRAGELVACGDTEEVCGSESLEDVFLELVEDAPVGRPGGEKGGRRAAGEKNGRSGGAQVGRPGGGRGEKGGR